MWRRAWRSLLLGVVAVVLLHPAAMAASPPEPSWLTFDVPTEVLAGDVPMSVWVTPLDPPTDRPMDGEITVHHGTEDWFNIPAGRAADAVPGPNVVVEDVPAGDYTLVADYPGDDTFAGASVSRTFHVDRRPSVTYTNASAGHPSNCPPGCPQNDAWEGSAITFSTTVVADTDDGDGAPTLRPGTVTFFVDGSPAAIVASPTGVARGVVTYTTTLALGEHTVRAEYSGDPGFYEGSSDWSDWFVNVVPRPVVTPPRSTLPPPRQRPTPQPQPQPPGDAFGGPGTAGSVLPVAGSSPFVWQDGHAARVDDGLRTSPLVAAVLLSGGGYWAAHADGTVKGVGAPDPGSVHGLNRPIVGIATTPSRRGMWLVASDGGVFCFGDAAFYGSTGGMRLNRPIVGMSSTPSGHGYWLVASDGGIFSFGDAPFLGSTGSRRLNQPVVAMAATAGRGYWLLAADGGIFTFGDAPFLGSGASAGMPKGAVAMFPTAGGNGYVLVDGSGGDQRFGVQ